MVTVTADMWTGLSIGQIDLWLPGLSKAIHCNDAFPASLKMVFLPQRLCPSEVGSQAQSPENGEAWSGILRS